MAKKALNNSETRRQLYKELHATVLDIVVTKLQVAEKSYVHPAHPRVWFHPYHSIERLYEDFSEAKMGRPESPYSKSNWASMDCGAPYTKVLFESLINKEKLPALKQAEEEAHALHLMVDEAFSGLNYYNVYASRNSTMKHPFGDYQSGTLATVIFQQYTHARRLIAEGHGEAAFSSFIDNLEPLIEKIIRPIEDHMEILRNKYLNGERRLAKSCC
tara:strand:- start:627 stop:1274 length:648 start_codon:yes stop_codon:yes gene_type:complete